MQNGLHCKPFFLKCIFEFMINTAPHGSNNVNGREKYFSCINFKKQTVQWSHGMRHHYLHWSKLGFRFKSWQGYEIYIIISIDNELTMKTTYTDGLLQRFHLEHKQINYVTDKPCEQLYKC